MSRTFLSQSPISLILLGASLQLTGCMGRQTGSEIDADDANAEGDGLPYCKESTSTPVPAGEAIEGSTLSEEVLAAAIEGEFESELAWNANSSGDVVITPESGDSSISIHIEAISGSAEWVEMKVVQPERQNGEDGAAIDLDLPQIVCSNFLRMDARVTVKSANGAFDDSFVASFSSSDGHVALASIPLELDELNGSFAVDASALPNSSASANLMLSLGYGTLSGSIQVGVESHDSEAAMMGSIRAGHFPKNNPCENGTLLGLDSDLAESVDEALQQHTAFDFTWQGEESFELDVVPTLSALCLAKGYAGEPNAVTGAMTLALSSSGDEIEGTWPLHLNVELDEAGDATRVNVLRDSYMIDSFPAAEFEEKTGIRGVSSDAEELSYSFGYSIDLVESHPASGELTILELVIPDCLRDDYMPEVVEAPDGGSSSPGCSGLEVVESKFAQLSERDN